MTAAHETEAPKPAVRPDGGYAPADFVPRALVGRRPAGLSDLSDAPAGQHLAVDGAYGQPLAVTIALGRRKNL